MVVALAKGDVLNLNFIWTLLSREFWLSFIMGGLGIGSLSLLWTRHPIRRILAILLWIVWAGILFILTPALSSGISSVVANLGIVMLCVLMLPLAFDAFLSLGLLGVQAVLYSLQVWIVCVLLFDFPFILWALDFLPSYYLAAFLGILLGGGLLFWQSLFMQYYWYPFIHKKDEQTKTPGSQ